MKKNIQSYNYKVCFPCSSLWDFSACVAEKKEKNFVLKDTYAMVSLFIILFMLMLCLKCSAVIQVNLSMVLSIIVLIACIKQRGMLLC